VRVPITRVDPSLPLPEYQTAGAAGFDFHARLDTVIPPGEVGSIPSNVIIAVPEGYVLVVTLRSSAPRRKGLMVPHGVGIIDRDYQGPSDEIMLQVYNFTENEVVVQRGERIAQGLLMPVERCDWEEVLSPMAESRGGFGSTG
jgi:dUTP pyrophosphatase